jgi:nucleotidyltransferase substrate binding protein (TIGR01987 family)
LSLYCYFKKEGSTISLELSSLRKAIASLDRAWVFVNHKISNQVLEQNELEVLKAAVIQNFEFTYELCWKFMKRWLSINSTPDLMVGITRKQLFRYAAENQLIDKFDSWILYHELRNKTSHTYDILVADEIFLSAGEFLQDAKIFLNAIEVRND